MLGSIMTAYLSALASLPSKLLAPFGLAPASATRVNVEFACADSNGNGRDVQETHNGTDLRALVAKQCPSLVDGHFEPTWWLNNGHLQTLYCVLGDSSKTKATFERRVLLCPDGGTLALDFVPPRLAPPHPGVQSNGDASSSPLSVSGSDAQIPTVFCLHGLSGGESGVLETYISSCFSKLTAPKEEGGCGFRGVVMNSRGTGGTPLTSGSLYSASKTADVRCALLYLTKCFPDSPLIGLGFSLGANILAKYVGEEGEDTPLQGAVVVGNPWDNVLAGDELENGGWMQKVYSKTMASNLTRVVSHHLPALALCPVMDKPLAAILPTPDGRKPSHTLRSFDDVFTSKVGGLSRPLGEFPFNGADDYYAHSSSIRFLEGVRRPLLCLNALDDPVVSGKVVAGVRRTMGLGGEPMPSELKAGRVGYGVGEMDGSAKDKDTPDGPSAHKANQNIVLVTTPGGGHLGWWTGTRPTRWSPRPIVEFISALVGEIERREGPGYGSVRAGTSRWASADGTSEVEVEVELRGALPPSPSSSETPRKLRTAWLRTQLLDVSLSPTYKLSDPSKSSDPSLRDQPSETVKLTMYRDQNRPEVGFAEVPMESLGGRNDEGIFTVGKTTGVFKGL